jgi:ribosomal-protein-serine acetyltransferase
VPAGVPVPALRAVTVADLRAILDELDDFWSEDRDMAFLHQALYVHEFGETSVLAERDGRILGYLLGFVNQDGTGYVHAVAVRSEARGQGLARAMYARFDSLVRARGATGLKAITGPENSGSRAFHEALGFSVEEVEGYSPSAGARLVFTRRLREPLADTGGEVDLGGGVRMRPMRAEDVDELHCAIQDNRPHLQRWMPFVERSLDETAAHVQKTVRDLDAGEGAGMLLIDRDRLIGGVAFIGMSRKDRSTKIGYWLAEPAQGRGIMTRAVGAMVDQAFGPWGLRRVEIRVATSNARSRAIPERLGFREEGVLRAAYAVGQNTYDEVVYGLLAEDTRVTRT